MIVIAYFIIAVVIFFIALTISFRFNLINPTMMEDFFGSDSEGVIIAIIGLSFLFSAAWIFFAPFTIIIGGAYYLAKRATKG